jgi:hypothetical protein
MKITKKAKMVTVKVTIIKTTYTRSEYSCPSCQVTYDRCMDSNISRFYCDCGQELIVNNEVK